jgi:2-polyprenyl-3-methyl-5-hydroxy-6-metoxy-1,4-benzoquinol methylase
MMISEHPIEWTDENVSRLWNYYSKTPPYCDMYFSKLFGKYILQQSKLPTTDNLEVLDFGCGPGYLWDHAVKLDAAWSYTGIDFSSDSIAKLDERASGHKQFRGAHAISRLPTDLPTNHFDVALLVEVVEHLNPTYLSATFHEVQRVVKRGGIVVISTPNEEDLSASPSFCPECGAIFHPWQHVRSWSIDSLSKSMQQVGFSLRHYSILDLTEKGLSAKSVFRRSKRLMRSVLTGRWTTPPHLIATFQKI